MIEAKVRQSQLFDQRAKFLITSERGVASAPSSPKLIRIAQNDKRRPWTALDPARRIEDTFWKLRQSRNQLIDMVIYVTGTSSAH